MKKRKLYFIIFIAICIFFYCGIKCIFDYIDKPQYEKQYLKYMEIVKGDLLNSNIYIEYSIGNSDVNKNCNLICNVKISDYDSEVVTQQILNSFNNNVNVNKYSLIQSESQRIRLFIYDSTLNNSSWLYEIILSFDKNNNKYLPVELTTCLNPRISDITFKDIVLLQDFKYVQIAHINTVDDEQYFEYEILPYVNSLKSLVSLTFENSKVDFQCLQGLKNLEYLEIDNITCINSEILLDIPSLKTAVLNIGYIEAEEYKKLQKIKQSKNVDIKINNDVIIKNI